MPDLVERLGGLSAALVSDAQRDLQTLYTMDPAIHSLVPGIKLVGRAFTVLARGGSIITVHKALLEAPPGSVLVVGGETATHTNAALFGKLMATQARLNKIVGIVADGAVRDIADLKELRFPVFARGTTPHVGLNRMVGETQVPVPCGGIIVSPGDYVLGDDDGVAILPSALAERIIVVAEQKLAKESETLSRMQAGEQLSALIGFADIIHKVRP